MATTAETPSSTKSSPKSITLLPSSTPSSPPSEGTPAKEHNDPSTRVSKTMLEEEKKMEAASLRAEKKRQKEMEKTRQKDVSSGKESDESMYNKIQFLLGQSKVFASIMMSKMEKKEKDDDAKRERESKKEQKAERNPEKLSTGSHRRATRAGASTSKGSGEGQIQSTTASNPRQLATRPKNKKSDADIARYLKKEDLEAKGGTTSVAEALEGVAEDSDIKSTTIGAQNLRSTAQPELVSGGIMRGYQLEGLQWLITLYENGLNGILADEMGLGKTIQTISFLAFLRGKGTFGPFLIAAPLSTLSNWVEEFARFTPNIPVVLYHGSIPERAAIRDKKLKNPSSKTFPVVCTSYEICMNDKKYLGNYAWKYIIIDEGHRIKNLNCRLVRELQSYHSANRLLITGTPLQNNLAELWSLLNFLMPEIFNSLDSFESWFDFSALKDKGGHKEFLDGERKSSLVTSLHAILKPFLLRRIKTDVETSLPKKREYILYAPLSTTQKELYNQIKSPEGDSRAYLEDRVIERLTRSETNAPKSTRSMSLKRKANGGTTTPNKSAKSSRDSTPARSVRGSKVTKPGAYRELNDREYFKHLEESSESEEIDEEEQERIERAKTIALAKKEISSKKLQNPVMQLRLVCNSPHNFYWPWSPTSTPDSTLITESGKMLLLDRLLPSLFAKGHKVLLFSQFKTQLDIIEDYAELQRGWKICRIDGQVKQEDRRIQIKAFKEDPSYRLFLLSTRAGGQGINLAAADTVILFDSDWNPQQDLQAQDRAHRIGQTRPVVIYRLATKGTIEQTLLEKADGKRRLEKLVIQKGKFKSIASKEDYGDVSELQRILDEEDFKEHDLGEGDMILSDRDLEILTDRSEEAYARFARGEDGGKMFKAVETKKEGEGGLLEEIART
ncbi:MAG: hypothetical protein M1836_005830 [Candelina mexicana]|nr:MAG: hypothetical protein M1836_005830 [Candelina mexicana]